MYENNVKCVQSFKNKIEHFKYIVQMCNHRHKEDSLQNN